MPEDDMRTGRSPRDACTQPIYAGHRMRNFRLLSRSILQGDDTQLVVGFLGDSWVKGSGLPTLGDASRERYFMPRLAKALQSLYGNAGGGWCGLSHTTSSEVRGGSADPDQLYQAGVGSWTTQINNRPSPNLCSSVSSVPGDSIRVTCTQSATSEVTLHYIAGGTIEYRWNDRAWMPLDLGAGAGTEAELSVAPSARVVELSGFPTTAPWVLDLKVTSGTVELAGIEHRNARPGIRIHNLGAGASTTYHWQAVNPMQWQAGIAALNLQSALTLWGTNDQLRLTPAEHRAHLCAIVASLKASSACLDIALGTSPENGEMTAPRPSRPMTLYQAAARDVAIEHAVCHVDMQPVFGDHLQYRFGGVRALLDRSALHPAPAGVRLLEDFYLRMLTQGV